MICPNCNQPLKGDEFFCTHCGSSLPKVNLDKTEIDEQGPSYSNFEEEPPVTPVVTPASETPIAAVTLEASAASATPEVSVSSTPQYAPQNNYVNTIYTTVPPEINKWNWGAFFLSVYWGIGNSAYLTLLTFIPFFGFIWRFVCGAKGNEWAWKSGKFKSVDEFLAVQRTWIRGGIAFFIVTVLSTIWLISNILSLLASASSYVPNSFNF